MVTTLLLPESWRRICSTASTAVNISCGALTD
jgi:hypothetical protein